MNENSYEQLDFALYRESTGDKQQNDVNNDPQQLY